jgi:hypothetical protein
VRRRTIEGRALDLPRDVRSTLRKMSLMSSLYYDFFNDNMVLFYGSNHLFFIASVVLGYEDIQTLHEYILNQGS